MPGHCLEWRGGAKSIPNRLNLAAIRDCLRNSFAKNAVFNDKDRAWSILQNSVSGAPKQQSSQPGASVGTDNDEIDTDLLGRIDYLLIGIPMAQDPFGV